MCPLDSSGPCPLRNPIPKESKLSHTLQMVTKLNFNSDAMRRWLRSPEIRCFKSGVDEYGYILISSTTSSVGSLRSIPQGALRMGVKKKKLKATKSSIRHFCLTFPSSSDGCE